MALDKKTNKNFVNIFEVYSKKIFIEKK